MITRIEMEYYQSMIINSKKQTEALESIAKSLEKLTEEK